MPESASFGNSGCKSICFILTILMLEKVGVYFKKLCFWDSPALAGSAWPPDIFNGGEEEASTPHTAAFQVQGSWLPSRGRRIGGPLAL